ncbi:DUF6095 family protein [Antarcticibacterium sp. 1MA-6-2]|uniref:DUF6095 family protein n=1 Tax=Antarcticibacterium sp. 1MA-6-2 TaxID=2908210 RepID=UPI002882EC5A|nr:DUF6095 family protein [Antarcticibacterium sp. 1MA-6-2]
MKVSCSALPLSALGPVVLYSAFNNQEHPFYIPVLIIGLAACVAAIFLMFRGITTLVRSLFE